MSDFVCYFGYAPLETRFDMMAWDSELYLGNPDYTLHRRAGCRLATMNGQHPLSVWNDDSGWVAVRGIFHLADGTKAPTTAELLDALADGQAFETFAGLFCLAAWDARRGVGYGLKDPCGLFNLYVTEADDGVYLATNALLLAKSLGRTLSPEAVAEFLTRRTLLAPRTMFNGISRLNVGEHVVISRGRGRVRRHWYAYAENHTAPGDVLNSITSEIQTSITALCHGHSSVLFDLTGGYDSRLTIAGALAAGVPVSLTVNGTHDDIDVVIAHQVADKARLPIWYFDTAKVWARAIDASIRTELVWRTSGELPFTEIYHHFMTRPELSQSYGLHMIGIGGEFLRYHPWSHEFLGLDIGRRRRIDVARTIDYRFIKMPVGSDLVPGDWARWYRSRLADDIARICREGQGARTTEQLEAVHVWKMTGHSTAYVTSVSNWLPSAAPLLTANFVKAAMAVPWTMKVTSTLQRQAIQALAPHVARCRTAYGATAEPPRLRTAHLELLQLAKRAGHAARKVDKVAFRGAIFGRNDMRAAQAKPPFWSDDFAGLFDPLTMRSRAIYAPEALAALVEARPASGPSADHLLAIATIEQLCRILDVELDAGFLDKLAGGQGRPTRRAVGSKSTAAPREQLGASPS